tara:strand:+ start:896 stop:1627 length:732 start_codon:yes stop_codon:yes gene_type:complete
MEVVTYANKSAGLFDKLIKNEHNVKIKVLGWGKKWNGYMDKILGIFEYLKEKNDNDIVVYIDGFDTKIIKNLSSIRQKFKAYDCKVLVSVDKELPFFPLKKLTFDTCYGNSIANAGMFMGYVKYLKIILKDILENHCKDDQYVLNALCRKYNFIKLDINEQIFKNYVYKKESQFDDAIFISFPGSLNLQRLSRVLPEYLQFFFPYILIFHLILLAWLTKKSIIMTSLVLISVYYYFYCDRSCV